MQFYVAAVLQVVVSPTWQVSSEYFLSWLLLYNLYSCQPMFVFALPHQLHRAYAMHAVYVLVSIYLLPIALESRLRVNYCFHAWIYTD